MRIGVHQPEHLPWIGFFDRIRSVDAFVLLDHVDFSKNNFQNRNRIKNEKKATWEWLTIPVSKGENKSIQSVLVKPREIWKRAYLEKIRHNYHRNKQFELILEIVKVSIEQKSDFLVDINTKFIYEVLKYLDIQTPIFKSSQMQLKNSKSAMLVEICKELGGSEYVTGIGATKYLDKEQFSKSDISIVLRDPKSALEEYVFDGQRLSIIDELMKNGKGIREKLDQMKIREIILND